MDEIDYIVEAIRKNQCVLILGNEFNRAPNGKPYDKEFANYIIHESKGAFSMTSYDEENEKNCTLKACNITECTHSRCDITKGDLTYYKEEDLFFFNSIRAKIHTESDILNFYKNLEPYPVYQKIVEIPFNVILNLTPDNLLEKAFKNANVDHVFKYYVKNTAQQNFSESTFTKERPLIYNLFGNVEDSNSLVLTHDDLFDYLNSILSNFVLPADLQNNLKNAKYVLVLGFRYERWQMHIILRLLSFQKNNSNSNFVKYSSKESFNPVKEKFFNDQFEIEFIPHDFDSFLDEIHKQFRPEELRKANIPDDKYLIVTRAKQLISQNKIEEVLKEISGKVAERTQQYDILILIQARYSRLMEEIAKGTLSSYDANIEKNRILNSLLSLLNDI